MKRHMIKNMSLLGIFICFFMIGCHPKVINWSPNGQWAAYCNDVGLFFINAEGNISKKMCDNAYRAEWFSDSKTLAIEQFADLTTWKQIENTVDRQFRDKYVEYAQQLLKVRSIREWDDKVSMLKELNLLHKDELRAIKLYIRDVASADFPKNIIESWPDYIEYNYQYLRIGTWDGQTFTISEPLWESPERIWDMRISAKGRVVAFASAFPGDFEEGIVSSLWAVDIETEKLELLDKNTALYPDWDTAGMDLVYVRSIGKEGIDNPLGTLLKRRICDDDGALLDTFSDPQSLAGLVANEFTKVRCLKDGRILFSSLEVTLPVVGKDIPEQKQLFVLNPKQQLAITRLVPRSAQSLTHGYNFDFFEVSPDETVLSIPDDQGRVAAFTMATGDFTVLQSDGTEDIMTVPVWRYPNELCYVDVVNGGILGDKKIKHMVLQEVSPEGRWDQPRIISKGWPKEARKVILDR